LPGGYAGAELLAGEADELAAELIRRLVTVLERDEGLDDLHGHRVRLADHARLRNGGVLDQRALHLERAHQVTGRVDHVVCPADEPEVAFRVAARAVTGDVPAVAEPAVVALLVLPVLAEH